MGVAWAWSIGTALLEGARRHFELDDDDLDVIVQTARSADGRSRALEILWVDKILGGSGIIEAMVREFQQVAGAAVRHLEGHDARRPAAAAFAAIATSGSLQFKTPWTRWEVYDSRGRLLTRDDFAISPRSAS